MASPRQDNSETDEAGATPIPQSSGDSQKEQPRRFLESGRKNLSPEELASPAAGRFLIAEIERLDGQCAELKVVEKKYGDLRVEVASLQERATTSKLLEITSFACLSVGSAGLGAAPSYLSLDGALALGLVIAAGSTILVAVGVFARFKT